MTNHWADLDNASMFFVMGANPTENHPASMAHVNAARYGSKKARLVVVDPRKSRTAVMADLYVRIRPGTNIAFINGVINYILTEGYTNNATFAANFDAWHNSASTNFYNSTRAFRDDAGSTAAFVPATGIYATSGATGFGPIGALANRGWPKYTDSRFKVTSGVAAPVDYQRETFTVGTRVFSGFPVLADTIGDPDCVMAKLKMHVAPYTASVVADICNCAPSDIAAVGNEFINNSRMMSSDFDAALCTPSDVNYKATTIMYAMGITQHTSGSQNIRGFAILNTMLGNMGRPGGGINALRGIHNVQGSTDMGVLFDLIPGYSGNPGTTATWNDYVNPLFGNRTHPDATGGAAFAYKPGALGLQQRGFYNMVTTWFGPGGADLGIVDEAVTLTATDEIALAKAPAAASVLVYSGKGKQGTKYTVTTDYTVSATGITRVATGAITAGQTVYVSYHSTTVDVADQQVTMTGTGARQLRFAALTGSVEVWSAALKTGTQYTKDTHYTVDEAAGTVSRIAGGAGFITDGQVVYVSFKSVNWSAADIDKMYALWPKGNGNDHISGFRAMLGSSPVTKAAVVWGQNPCNTEPNQSVVRAAFENLDLLVVVDTFETETAACKRKTNGVTYLLPACSYVEEAGSVTNSGRWLQWRERARTPRGNSKADLELLLRFAKALDTAGAFSHITTQWATMDVAPGTNAFDVLYAAQYGYDGLGNIEAVTRSSADGTANQVPSGSPAVAAVTGTEAVAENAFQQMGQPLASGGTLWIWTEAYNWSTASARPTAIGALASIVDEARTLKNGTAVSLASAGITGTPVVRSAAGGLGTLWTLDTDYTLDKTAGTITWKSAANGLGATDVVYVTYTGRAKVAWTKVNRAKSRNNTDKGEALTYSRWGYSWLVNRRVLYNNSEVPGDEADTFVAPDVVARLFCMDSGTTLANYAYTYRAYNKLKDMPTKGIDGNASKTDATKPHKYAGRFPAHTEPTETPRRDLAHVYGRNMAIDAALVKTDTNVALWSSAESGYTDPLYLGTTGSWDKDAKTYPLVLTTIRCVEHFQGGPITRNNSWNLEAEPVPWIEINSVDARREGIKDGDWVNVITARSNSISDQEGRTALLGAATPTNKTGWAKGFKARVGSGLQGNQRVGAGVVAIPWHWGDAGLGTGSRANDLCIDSYDANTIIPEYKACLCKIEKIV